MSKHSILPQFLLSFTLLFHWACVSETVYPQSDLIEQILRPRKGYDGKLTNRACLSYEGESCVKDNVLTYDLSDQDLRNKLRALSFICNIGGKRFKICPDKPGFCRTSYKKDCFLFFCKEGEREIEYLPIVNYQFLLDAKTKCFNKDIYPFESL